jgi:hypothetical protein
MELTKDRKVSVIETYDGKEIFLNEEQDKKIQQLESGGKAIINYNGKNETIYYGNIRGVYSIELWQQYSKKEYGNTETELPKTEPVVYTKKTYLKALKNMIDGFKKAFDGKEIPQNSQKILTRMLEKYEKIEKQPEDKKFNNPALDFIKL